MDDTKYHQLDKMWIQMTAIRKKHKDLCPGHILLVMILILCWLPTSTSSIRDYIIIGAGPGGLQMGYFLQQAGRDYVIMERASVAGNFYTHYPRHGRLISINKRHTGKTNAEFNMRHDWNSLISHDKSLLFKHYSKEFFPPSKVLVKYLNDFQERLKINVQYNSNIHNINRLYNETSDMWYFTMEDQNGTVYSCRTLIVATGLWKPNVANVQGAEFIENYDTVSVDPDDYEGKTVLILGRGNAAFEVAESIYGATNLIHMLGRSRVRLSWETHYVGDLRAINNNLLDTYQLKSLDGVLEANVDRNFRIEKKNTSDEKLTVIPLEEVSQYDNFALREDYDKIISCLGFNFDSDIFSKNVTVERPRGRRKKYPFIKHNYESISVPNMYFAGTATHSLDHRKSAGGFIHGFRYTTEALFNLLEWKNHKVKWPSISGDIEDLINILVKRINEASGIYQMFGLLGDVIAIRNNGRSFDYIKGFPIHNLHSFHAFSGHEVESLIVLVMQYGQNFSGPGQDIFAEERATGEPSEGHLSNFLHPVLYYYKKIPSVDDFINKKGQWYVLPRPDRIHHMVEDFLTVWDAPLSHILPLRRFIETIVDNDLRSFFSEDCLKLAMTYSKLPKTCEDFLRGAGLSGTEQLVYAAYKSGMLI